MLAAALFAHESAAFCVHALAGFGGDLLLVVAGGARRGIALAGAGARLVDDHPGSAWAVTGVIGCAEEAGERGDGFEQQRVDAGLLVGGVPGLVLGDGTAVLGLGGELVQAGGDRGVGGGRRRVAGPGHG
jgi:hypothetical protein